MAPYVPKSDRERLQVINAQEEFLRSKPEATPTEIAAFTRRALNGGVDPEDRLTTGHEGDE